MSYPKLFQWKLPLLLCVILLSIIPHSVFCQQVDTVFSYTLNNDVTTSAGIFNNDGTLIRTLWSGIQKKAGTYKIKWNGTDDNGHTVPNGSYTAKVLSNNLKAVWEGGCIGNTSDSMTGPTKYHGYENTKCMVIAGTKAFVGCGYTEGTPTGFLFNLSSPGQKTFLLNNSGLQQECFYNATDGNNIYWGGFDPTSYNDHFVYATKVTDNSEAAFTDGALYSRQALRTYSSIIDHVVNTNGHISGMACAGGYLFVSHGSLNKLDVIKVGDGSGTLVQTITSFTSPGNLAADGNGNLWVISGTNTVGKYPVNTDGSLGASTLSISTLVAPSNIAISPDNHIVAICDAGISQQVKAFNNDDGDPLWTFGDLGGYANDPNVNNHKFYFSDQTGDFFTPFIRFQSDGSFWVHDRGNYRIQHYDANRNFLDRVMFLPNERSVQVCNNDPNRVFVEYLEFAIDYSKTLDNGNNGSWTLVKNWRGKVQPQFWQYYNSNILSSVSTLSNGKTYAIEERRTDKVPVLVELTAAGERYTGIELNINTIHIYPDGSLRYLLYNGPNSPQTWIERPLTGFDNSDNPIWGNVVALTSTNQTTVNDPFYGGSSAIPPVEITSGGIIACFSGSKPPLGSSGYHLGGIKVGDTSWLWKTALPTRINYRGNFPSDGYFDIGNDVQNAGNLVRAIDSLIIWGYNGEFWKNGQVNKYNIVHENGLFIGQFGVTGKETNMLGESPAQMAGNAFSWNVVKVDNDYYLYHCDESIHGGIHRWKISGINSIQIQSITLTSSFTNTSEADSIQGVDLMAGLPFDSVLQDNTHGWTRSIAAEDYTNYYTQYTSAKTSMGTYDKRKSQDLGIRYIGYPPLSINRDLGSNVNLSSWKLSGKLNYEGNFENVNGGMYLDVLDKEGKILVRFYTSTNYTDYYISIYANGTLIASGNNQNMKDILSNFQPINISINKGSITVEFASFNPVNVNIYDTAGDITSPKTMRVYFENVGGTNQGKNIDLADMKFAPTDGSLYFRSKQSGNWNDVRNWQTSPNGVEWIDAKTVPSSADSLIFIQVGHIVKVTDNVTVDQLFVNDGGTLQVSPNATLIVNDGPVDDIIIAPTGKLIIQSDSTGTGKIGNSSGTIEGNVTVERYISASKNASFRLLTPSINTINSMQPFIRDNWQEGQNNTSPDIYINNLPDYGTQITGSADGSNGFDASLPSYPSMYIFDQVSYLQQWVPVLNTDATNLDAKRGYLIFVRGDRGISANGFNSSNTTLRATGKVLMGKQRFTNLESDGRISLVTNPYASPINWNTVYYDSTTGNSVNFEDYFIYWDPNLGVSGGYATVKANGTSNVNTEDASLQIQSGQAFFVVTKSGVNSPTLTINESHKSSNSSLNNFRSGIQETFMTSLYFNDSIGKKRQADAVKAVFDTSFSNAVDKDDAVELANRSENIAILRNGKMLSIENRSRIADNDTLPIATQNLQVRDYEWQFTPADFKRPDLQACLWDKYLNICRPVSLSKISTIAFSVSSNAASAAEDRFQIIFSPNQILPVSITSVKAHQKEALIEVNWTVQNETDIEKYVIEKSFNGSNFIISGTVKAQVHNSSDFEYSWFDSNPQNGNNFYRIKSINNSGAVKYTKVVNVSINDGKGSFHVYPNPLTDNYAIIQFISVKKGAYTMQLINSRGQVIFKKKIDHTGGSASQTIPFSIALPEGTFTLQITGNGILYTKQLLK